MINLTKLLEQFPQEAVSWRAQSVSGDGTVAMALAYIDARDVMGRLDAVCGMDGWQCRYSHANGKTVCDLAIKCGDEWVWKADGCGDTDIEAEKGALSDAFKRAAVRWGIGRYLYDMGTPWVPCESYKAGDKWKFSKFKANPWDCLSNKPAPAQQPKAAPIASANPDDLHELRTLVALGATATGLGEFETKFITDYQDKIAKYGDKVNKPSAKQLEILKKIAAKAKAPTEQGMYSDIPDHVTQGMQY